jgi:chemosensory pili system protein ChpB (putative protein-glutamate methylesterase)
MAEAVRVALLARPGAAREQLRKSLAELGATLVAEGDPAELDPAAVAQQTPNLVLVSLEPAIEGALDRFDSLLATDGVEVMYDDAEVTRNLEGWDLARWARHLAAKLMGSDLLPPAPENAQAEPDLQPVPGAPPTPAQLMDHAKLEDYTAESPDLAEWVPTNPSLTEGAVPEPDDAPARPREADELPDFDLDLGDIESAMGGLPAADTGDATAEPGNAPASEPEAEEFSFGDLSLELGGLEDFVGKTEAPAAELSAETPADEPLLADLSFDESPVRFSNYDEPEAGVAAPSMDDDVAALMANFEEFEKTDTREAARDPDFSWAPSDTAAKAPELRATPASTRPPPQEVAAPAERSFDLSGLSLLDENSLPVEPIKPKPVAAPTFDLNFSLEPMADEGDEPPPPPPKPAAVAAAPKVSFDVGSLALESLDAGDEVEAALPAQPGAVLVVAGMGGPDAVRQFLSHLPHALPVPVLLYQHLEVGKHERLVDQLAKISRLPVYLAVAGETAQPGKVAVLRAGMGAEPRGDGLAFAEGSLESLVRALPARDSVLVMLSGADPALVPAAKALRDGGGQAVAQSADSCFDAAASQALAAQGATTLPAAQLAGQVSARWPA